MVAVAAVIAAWAWDAAPFAPVVAVALIAAFDAVAVRGAVRPAKVIGFQQMCFGVAVVVVTAVAVLV